VLALARPGAELLVGVGSDNDHAQQTKSLISRDPIPLQADPQSDLGAWFRLFARLQGERFEEQFLNTLSQELAAVTGAKQITLHRSRPGQGTQIQPVLGEPAKLSEDIPDALGEIVIEGSTVCTMVYNGWRETIWLVLVVEDSGFMEVFPGVAPQIGELLYSIHASESARAQLLQHLQEVRNVRAQAAALLRGRGYRLEVAFSREDVLWEAIGSLHHLLEIPLAFIIGDDATETLRALASDPHGNRYAVHIRNLELVIALRHTLLKDRGRAFSGLRAQWLASLFGGTQALDWFYVQPVRVDEHFQGLIGVGMTSKPWLADDPAAQEMRSDLEEATAHWHSNTRLQLMAVVSAVAGEIAQFIRSNAVREQAFDAGATKEGVNIGMDIHDSLLPELAHIRLQLEMLKASAPETIGPQMDRVIEDLGRTSKEARELATTLTSAERWHDAVEVIEEVADRFRARAAIPLDLRIQGGRRELGNRLSIQLVRVFQEALNNVWKHAGATRVTAELTYLPGSVRLTVADNGHGFNPQGVELERLGIRGMERRAKEVGGELKLESDPEKGTTVRFEIPA
jgi:signal transduction histidine kinase